MPARRSSVALVEVAREQPVHPLASLGAPVGLGSAHTELDGSLDVLGLHQLRVLLRGQLVQHSSHEALGVDGVGLHVAHDHLHGHIGGRLVPAVVVSGHADHLVGDLGLAGQLGLGQAGHVDDAATPGAVQLALSAGGELRSLYLVISNCDPYSNRPLSHTHADQSTAVVQDDTLTLQAVSTGPDDLGNTLIEGVTEGNVSDDAALEEGEGTDTLGAVDDLVGNDKITGLDLLLQATDGGEGDDGADTDGAQSGDVGAGRDLVGSNLVVQTVTAQEGDGDRLVVVGALVVQDGNGGGGGAPRSRDVQRRNLGEARELTQTSTANNGDTDGLYDGK